VDERVAIGEKLLFSGHEKKNAPHAIGVAVALLLSKAAQSPHRVASPWPTHHHSLVQNRQKRINMYITQCYAPTNDSDEDTKEQFYSKLQTVIEIPSRRDIDIVMDDLNTKVGSDNTGFEEVVGLQVLKAMNDSGKRFTNLCAINNFVIGGTPFPHKRTHNRTWILRDHSTESQINHACI
jgi:hypothetical protein